MKIEKNDILIQLHFNGRSFEYFLIVDGRPHKLDEQDIGYIEKNFRKATEKEKKLIKLQTIK